MQPGIESGKMLKVILLAVFALFHQTVAESVKGAVSLNTGVFDKVHLVCIRYEEIAHRKFSVKNWHLAFVIAQDIISTFEQHKLQHCSELTLSSYILLLFRVQPGRIGRRG